jgi:competence protein ComEC
MVAADVGQGTAVVVRTHRHLLVYDTGPVYTPEADAGQRVLVPLLRGWGEREVHRLVLSHRDADHIGGADSLMAALPVAAVSSSLDPADPSVPTWPPGRDVTLRAVAARLSEASHTRCADGQSWQWDGVRFEMLHPLQGAAAPKKANAVSCVLRVIASDGTSLLLTGDIEAPHERALVYAQGAALQSTVMTVPHHGSRTSSTPLFLDTVAPRMALVQAAYRSPFGHPAADVVARYEARGSTVVRSDRCGAWTWRSDEPTGVCERDRQRRYWHWRPVPLPGRENASEPAGDPALQAVGSKR